MDPLEELHPAARKPVALWVDRCARELGLRLELFDAWRDDAAQLANWQKGRNTAGEVVNPAAVVTNARPGGSYHNLAYPNGTPCSLAIHGRVVASDGNKVGFGALRLEYQGARKTTLLKWWTDGTDATLTPRQMVLACACVVAEECGLYALGRSRHLQDWCHVEFRVKGATLEQVKAMILHQGDIQVGGLRT